MRSIPILGLAFIALLFSACGGDSAPEEKFPEVLDLLENSIPIKIKAPKDAEVVSDELFGMQSVVVKGPEFYVQIYGNSASSADESVLKEQELNAIKSDTICVFTRFVSQDDNGFVYEKVCDGDTTKYFDFRYVILKGNRSYTFQTTTTTIPPLWDKPFTEEQVKEIYAAIRPQKLKPQN